MSRRTIANGVRTVTDGIAVHSPVTPNLQNRQNYRLYAGEGDKPKEIAVLSCRFGRAIRRACREGKYYPNAFMAYDLKGYRHYVHVGLKNHLRGQAEARAAVTKTRPVDWDSNTQESLMDVVVDIIRKKL